ncbi:unnamed protein product [Prorocentrum cordatum]|uniref:Reverse transcriptase domain-containing protein n=1 Tax=Prorocentrum cordatum TaxID=2364126 RepID=A0ABN9UG44_9DINO|nr:unnamed protein product [Polarella glacialis]
MASAGAECDARWQEHFAAVTGGQVCPDPAARECPLSAPVGFRTTPSSTLAANLALPSFKGVGPDSIPAEFLKAGGGPLAIAHNKLQNRIGERGEWPWQWQGGRCVPILKGKGPRDDCDEYRGLLLADHMSKSFVGQIKDRVDEHYNDGISQHQYGAVPRRGADMAAHVIRSLIDRAHLMKYSIFVLFVDLSKAFDKICRELVLG